MNGQSMRHKFPYNSSQYGKNSLPDFLLCTKSHFEATSVCLKGSTFACCVSTREGGSVFQCLYSQVVRNCSKLGCLNCSKSLLLLFCPLPFWLWTSGEKEENDSIFASCLRTRMVPSGSNSQFLHHSQLSLHFLLWCGLSVLSSIRQQPQFLYHSLQ